MNRGKDICKELKAVRKQIAEENGIPLEIKECTYQGPCRGTCPRCEAEVRYLENSLANRLKMGKVATVAGLALGLASCGGGQPQGGPTPPSGHPSQEGTADAVDGARPEVPEGPSEIINVPDLGEIEVCGDVENVPPPPDESVLLGVVEEIEPVFPGGIEAMYKFIQDNLQYPRLALENAIEGKVYVTFVVEEDGSITNPRILRDIGGGCGREALRVVNLMPKWKPGEQQPGKPVRVQYNLPVNFVLPEDRPRIIEKMAPMETDHRVIKEDRTMGMPCDTSDYEIGPNAPTQQMKVDGVKVIVK